MTRYNVTAARLPADLPQTLRAAGLVVVELPGWQTRERPASTGSFAPVGVLCHHTASRLDGIDGTKILVNGRSDLPGPLAHFGLARNGTVYVVAAGRANHAGKAKASGTVAAGDGNALYIGIEAMNDGVGEPWPKAQYDAYVRLCAVLCLKVTGSSAQTVRGHKETSVTGKPDPLFDMAIFRQKVAAEMLRLSAPKPPTGPAPLRYTVTTAKPTGKEYHGPGHPRSAAGLARYHETNSLRGARKAKALGYARVDLDVMLTKDLVLVVNHSFDAMGKEHFKAEGVPRLPIDQLTWDQVKRLRAPDGTRIQKLSTILAECERLGIWAALDLKGDAREGYRIQRALGRIARLANASGAAVYLKCDPRKRGLRVALDKGRELGFWTRFNYVPGGSTVLRRPR